jgi:ElaB/YqjD/DUF883 family membrane-anchored ribosome-binding protein
VAEPDPSNGVKVVPRNEDEEIARLRGEIALSRQRIGSSLHQIEERMSARFDWRHWVRQHPWTSLAAGAVLGYTFGQFGRGRRSSPPAPPALD